MMPEVDMCEGGGWAKEVSREVLTEGLRHERLPERPGTSFPAHGGLRSVVFDFSASLVLEGPRGGSEGWKEPICSICCIICYV